MMDLKRRLLLLPQIFCWKLITKQSVLIVTFVSFVIFYNEVYLYHQQLRKFKHMECQDRLACQRVLFVADPQLIGLQDEIIHFLTPLTIFDSDRYLAKTYSLAINNAKPDIVIFLGDIFDEGSKATNEEFKYYMDRFIDTFQVNLDPSSQIRYIFLPGDNDIGGEGRDQVTKNKVNRFGKTFTQPDSVKLENVTYFKVNRLIQSIPRVAGSNDFYNTNYIRVVLSHMPLMFMPSLFVDRVLKTIQPHVIFTAHIHKSMIISTDGFIQRDRQIVPVIENEDKVYHFLLGTDNMYEIIVPTCSYRMGTDRIGYGFAVLEKDQLQYTVLWSPSRFTQLLNYLYSSIPLTLYLLIVFCRCRRRTLSTYSTLNNNKPDIESQ